jgi:integral membrane protein
MSALKNLRLVALLEGTSFVVLLFIAMPLKYWFDAPLAVRVVGMLHGLLFVAFMVVLMRASVVQKGSLARWALAFLSSLLPFGTFVFDRSLKREIEALEPASAVVTP